jgi:hypothetical protein
MTAPKTIESSLPDLQTPYSLSPEDDPRSYLRGLSHWPGMPTTVCRRHLKDSDRKKIAELFAELEKQAKIELDNDSQRARETARVLFQSHDEADLIRAEELTRASMKMSVSACIAAKKKQTELRDQGKQFAAGLALKMADLLMPEFVADAVAVEGRLLRGGLALNEQHYNQGSEPITRWLLWDDVLLSGSFAACWFLRYHWPAEFLAEKYSPGAWADWLLEIVKGD